MVDSDFEHNRRLRFTIKDSQVRRPNAVLDTWNVSGAQPKNTIENQNEAMPRLAGAGRSKVGEVSEEREGNDSLKPASPLKHQGERFSFGRGSTASKGNSSSFIHLNRLLISEEADVYVPNSRQPHAVQTARRGLVKGKLSASKAAIHPVEVRGRVRNRDKSASTFGGRPLSPTHIEKSKVLAKNRRLDTSKIREVPQALQSAVQTDSSPSTSRSSERVRRRGPNKKQPQRIVQNCKAVIRYKLPMQEVSGRPKGPRAKPDFEPIIMEEVYYNENVPRSAKRNRARESVSITPPTVLHQALKL